MKFILLLGVMGRYDHPNIAISISVIKLITPLLKFKNFNILSVWTIVWKLSYLITQFF